MKTSFKQVDLKTAHRRGSLHLIPEAPKEGGVVCLFACLFIYFTEGTSLKRQFHFDSFSLTELNSEGNCVTGVCHLHLEIQLS